MNKMERLGNVFAGLGLAFTPSSSVTEVVIEVLGTLDEAKSLMEVGIMALDVEAAKKWGVFDPDWPLVQEQEQMEAIYAKYKEEEWKTARCRMESGERREVLIMGGDGVDWEPLIVGDGQINWVWIMDKFPVWLSYDVGMSGYGVTDWREGNYVQYLAIDEAVRRLGRKVGDETSE